jgi:hypothetical protein
VQTCFPNGTIEMNQLLGVPGMLGAMAPLPMNTSSSGGPYRNDLPSVFTPNDARLFTARYSSLAVEPHFRLFFASSTPPLGTPPDARKRIVRLTVPNDVDLPAV